MGDETINSAVGGDMFGMGQASLTDATGFKMGNALGLTEDKSKSKSSGGGGYYDPYGYIKTANNIDKNLLGSNISAPFLTDYYPSGSTKPIADPNVYTTPKPFTMTQDQANWLGGGRATPWMTLKPYTNRIV